MDEVTVGLGIVLSLLLSETLGVTAGGIIVPGYMALYLHQPIQVIITLLVAIIVWVIIRILSKKVFENDIYVCGGGRKNDYLIEGYVQNLRIKYSENNNASLSEFGWNFCPFREIYLF